SGEWFFRFFIADHFFLHAIHLNDWPKFPRPPLGALEGVNPRDLGNIGWVDGVNHPTDS
ncbi:hypothetical protein SAMN05444414_1181, partial [Roseovarius marisflavi]